MNIKNLYRFTFNKRELEIKFNIHMEAKVDNKVISILTDLFLNRNPINKMPKVKFILRNKKRLMGGTVNIPKLYKKEAIVYIDYPGMFTENDKHNYERKSIKYFDEEDFIDTTIHETAHAYHCLHSNHAFKILKILLKCDKFKNRKLFHKLKNELIRLPAQIYLEGYAQIVNYFGKYYFFTKTDLKKQHSKMLKSATELNKIFNKTLLEPTTKNKNLLFDKLDYEPYHLGTRIYYFILYFDRKETFNTIIKHDLSSLFNKFERLMLKNGLKVPISYNSKNGVFDINSSLKEIIKRT